MELITAERLVEFGFKKKYDEVDLHSPIQLLSYKVGDINIMSYCTKGDDKYKVITGGDWGLICVIGVEDVESGYNYMPEQMYYWDHFVKWVDSLG